MITVNVPSNGFLETVRLRNAVAAPDVVATVLGTMVAVTPAGRPEMVRSTGSENPFTGVTVNTRLADCPPETASDGVETESEKSVT